ncbi:MAG: hypothetical protein ACJ77K_04880 [Bacteroidia bacterium]
MKKLVILFSLFCSLSLFAQSVKYKKIFYKDQSIENMDVAITVTDAVAVPGGLKFRLTITNKSTDYILFKPTECEFQTKGASLKPAEKPFMIKPKDKDAIVLDMKTAQNMLPDDFHFVMGGIYRVSLNGTVVNSQDFVLPATANDFKAGDFSFTLDKTKKETASSWAKFKVVYNGNHIGIIQPAKISMRMPDGKEYASYNRDKPIFLEKDKTDDFTPGWKDVPIASGDMQLVQMNIEFHDAFRETVPVQIPALELVVQFDKEASDAKGK